MSRTFVLVVWLTAMFFAATHSFAEEAKESSRSRVVLRRLNRVEYENTVRELLGINAELKELLPLDSSAAGFDNVGEALHMSSYQMEKYLEAADKALNFAISNMPQPPVDKKRFSLKEQMVVKSSQEDVYRKRDDTVVLFSSSPWNAVTVTSFYPRDRGTYRIRISAFGEQSQDKPVTFRVDAGPMLMGTKSHLVSYYDAAPDKPTLIEFTDHFEARDHFRISPYGLAGAQKVKELGAEKYDGPGLGVEWVEYEGPLHDAWPPESHRRIFGDLKQDKAPIYNYPQRVEVVSDEPLADAERILRKFTRRAFRRPVTDADIQPLMKLVEAKLAEKRSFEQAVRVALSAVLVSPDFLFLREEPGQLDDFALASRLSYFLSSSMPDEELLASAGRKELVNVRGKESVRDGENQDAASSNPNTLKPSHSGTSSVLQTHVERLLNSPKAAQFTTNFTGQWLGLRDIDFTEPSHLLYPEYDDMLKVSSLRETELFFDELLKHDLPITNFLASDFTMLNGRLAKHYGIPDVHGFAFHKTKLPPESHRGGVLTMASVLKVTANGTLTSPITRGVWVLDRILGQPPEPPPENVAALEPDIRGATTIREQLAKHRAIESCASCHVDFDPLGFALENFDVIGGWRDRYRTNIWARHVEEVRLDGRKMPYYHGLKVDPADKLADGREFQNIDDFKQLLLANKDQFARALTVKLLTYATGAAPTSADDKQVEAIVAKCREKNYGFRTLIHAIVASELFQRK